MPKLRSGLSEIDDDWKNWKSSVSGLMGRVLKVKTNLCPADNKKFRQLGKRAAKAVSASKKISQRSGGAYGGVASSCPDDLRQWLEDEKLRRFLNNETRGHMLTDLERYFFAALYGKIVGVSPKAINFPRELAPHHRNWRTGKFADRFRVQLSDFPASTITSHISKDGHYFIHPDPVQCRSLTVREAARIQTFPDNYFFKGNRTEQFVQVGNAVPPFLAKKIAAALLLLLGHAKAGEAEKSEARSAA
jgi:DNA (cytosine-5)-methyltransferase 1